MLIAAYYEQILGRPAQSWEIDEWVGHLLAGADALAIWNALVESPEAKARGARSVGDMGGLVLDGYELILGRSVLPSEYNHWRARLSVAGTSSEGFAFHLLQQARNERDFKTAVLAGRATVPGHPILGREELLTKRDWDARAPEAGYQDQAIAPSHTKLAIEPHGSDIKVSIICSVYGGAAYIDQYLKNIVSQTVFDQVCELIIIDACSPDGEAEAILPYVDKFPGRVVYERLDYRATIYDAWNIGIRRARGDYVTNANLDDLRREDSIEIQCATLDNMSFVDVVYQDVVYSLDSSAPFSDAMQRGFTSDLPIVTPQNLLTFNSPHNGPMWRKSLHDDVGMFDASLRSAGDWQFWMRCLLSGKKFYKINDPHVLYYVNPEGISTAVGGVGLEEGHAVMRRFGRQMLPKEMLESFADFSKRLGVTEAISESAPEPEEGRYLYVHAFMREAAYASE